MTLTDILERVNKFDSRDQLPSTVNIVAILGVKPGHLARKLNP